MAAIDCSYVRTGSRRMKLTKAREEFLKCLYTLNTAGMTPNVLEVAAAAGNGLSPRQTLCRYKVYKQLIDQGLVGDLASGRTHTLRITGDGLRAIEEV